MVLFQSTFSTCILFVLLCVLIQPMNIYKIYNVLGKMKLFMFSKNLREFKINLRKYYFSIDLDYRFKHLTHFYWTHFSSGNTSCFHLKCSENKTYRESHNILFIPKKYISCYAFVMPKVITRVHID